MKKFLYNIIFTILLAIPAFVFASGGITYSPSTLTIEEGSTKTFTITAVNTIGDVYIKSNNTVVATVSTGEWSTGMVEENVTKTGTITVTGASVGSTTITLSYDAATFDEEPVDGTGTITVNVIEKVVPKEEPKEEPKKEDVKPTQPEVVLSKNNSLKSISVTGYELVKVNNNSYTLTVDNNVTSVSVNALAVDSKAKVSGTGIKNLVVGDNRFEVVITSESGLKNKIILTITRKDSYKLEEVTSLLEDTETKEVAVVIEQDSKITKDVLEQIKESKKVVNLDYFGEGDKLLYSWSIDGSKVNDTTGFETSISFTAEKKEEIDKASNNADGVYVKFEHKGSLPTGTKVRLYVGDKYVDGDKVNLYYFNEETKALEPVKEELIVTNGYIEFELEHCSEYLVTMATIDSDGNVTSTPTISSSKSLDKVLIIVIIIAGIIIVALVVFIIVKIKPNDDNKKVEEEEIKDEKNDLPKEEEDELLKDHFFDKNDSSDEDDK